MRIDGSNFTLQQLEMMYNMEIMMGDIDSLSEYNSAPYFNIKKFYKEETLVGYAVVFLGYNGIESSDVSLEDVAYFGEDINDLVGFLQMVKNANYTLGVNNFYYISHNLDESLKPILDELGFIESSLRR